VKITLLFFRQDLQELGIGFHNHPARFPAHIHLTPKGKAMGREASRVIVEANAEFLQVLTEEQKRDLHSIISTLRLNVPRP